MSENWRIGVARHHMLGARKNLRALLKKKKKVRGILFSPPLLFADGQRADVKAGIPKVILNPVLRNGGYT